MKEIWIRLRAIKGLGILLIGLAVGVMLLFLGGHGEEAPPTAATEEGFSFEAYEKGLAARIEEMLGRMDGISEVHVMLTLEESYAEQLAGADGEYLTVRESDGGQGTVTVSRIAPKVKGVAVICKGGSHSERQKKIIAMLSSLLDLPSHRIFVSEG